MYLLKYFKTKEWKEKSKQKMIAKEYKQFIHKEKQKILLLALAPQDTNTIA